MSDPTDLYFDSTVTPKDRAIFELGIKLGTLFHQFSGSPIGQDEKCIHDLTRGIEASIRSQPFVTKVAVKLNIPVKKSHRDQGSEFDRVQLKEKTNVNPYDYTEISGRNLQAKVSVTYKEWDVVGNIEWIPKMQYPLMFISKISKKNHQHH